MSKPLLLLIISVFAALRLSATNVSGPVTTNTLWSVVNSPYIVTGNVLVMEGITLTIEPGVEVRFDASKALQVNGTLVARGTATDSIRFTSNTTQIPGAWGNIYFTNSSADVVVDNAGNYVSGSIMEYCLVEYGGTIEDTDADMLKLDEALPGIRHCTIKNALNAGIGIYYPYFDPLNYRLDNNAFRQCRIGIEALCYSKWLSITNSSFIMTETGIDIFGYTIIDNNLFSQNSQVLKLTYGEQVITNNEFSDNLTTSTYPYPDNFIISLEIQGVDFRNNLCQRNGSDLLYLRPEGVCRIRSNIFTDNVYYSTTGSLIEIDEFSSWEGDTLFMENNLITNNGNFKPLSVSLMGLQTYFTSNVITNNYTSEELIDVYNYVTQGMDSIVTTFKDNVITQNHSTSDILTSFKGVIALHENSLFNNSSSAYVLKNANTPTFQPYLDVSNNYWGVETVEELSAIIYDFFDDANLGITMYDSILLAPTSSNPVLPPAGVQKNGMGNNRVQLSWLPNSESDIKGYNVYWGSYAGYTFEHMADAGLNTSFIVEGASIDDIIAVTAYDNDYISGKKSIKWLNENMLNGHESAYSYELHFPLGINEIKETADFSVYPVPACEKITIELNNPDDYSTLSIVNIQGQTLKTIHLTNSKTEVGIEEFTRGIYFVVLSGSKGISIKKVIRM